MLRVENISTGYGKKQVLFDVSFEVKQGEIVLLAGGNGSGKSTLLKAVYGILPQWGTGQIFLNDENITGQPTTTLLKKGLLYLPQKNNIFEDLTVQENLEIAGLTIKSNTLKGRIDQALSIFTSLKPHLQRIPMKLSGGERQLLALAMATLHEPKMLLIDEPFTGLTTNKINVILEYFLEISNSNKTSFLIVEHNINECSKIVSNIIHLNIGKLSI